MYKIQTPRDEAAISGMQMLTLRSKRCEVDPACVKHNVCFASRALERAPVIQTKRQTKVPVFPLILLEEVPIKMVRYGTAGSNDNKRLARYDFRSTANLGRGGKTRTGIHYLLAV